MRSRLHTVGPQYVSGIVCREPKHVGSPAGAQMQSQTGKAKPHETCLRREQLKSPSAVPCLAAGYALNPGSHL